MSLHRSCLPWQKLTQKIVKLTRACRLTVAGLRFVFVNHGAGIRRATYLCLDCAKNVYKNWNITVAFIIHVNLDHAWAEHYPVTLIGMLMVDMVLRTGGHYKLDHTCSFPSTTRMPFERPNFFYYCTYFLNIDDIIVIIYGLFHERSSCKLSL